MRMRLVVLVTIAALAAPAFAEGVKNKDDELKVIESIHHWYVSMMSASGRETAPAKQPVELREVFALVQTSPHHKLGMALEESWRQHLIKTVCVRFCFNESALTFGVADHKRTNRFVKSQSGPIPIHADNGALRKI